jgi:hypothetical protein
MAAWRHRVVLGRGAGRGGDGEGEWGETKRREGEDVGDRQTLLPAHPSAVTISPNPRPNPRRCFRKNIPNIFTVVLLNTSAAPDDPNIEFGLSPIRWNMHSPENALVGDPAYRLLQCMVRTTQETVSIQISIECVHTRTHPMYHVSSHKSILKPPPPPPPPPFMPPNMAINGPISLIVFVTFKKFFPTEL